MRRAVCLVIASLVAACGPSLDEIRAGPVRFTAAASAPWDQVGTCLARAYDSDYDVRYLPMPSTSSAEIIVTRAPSFGPREAVVLFNLVGAGGETKITVRQADFSFLERDARRHITGCGGPSG
jgi:hypothetical protein